MLIDCTALSEHFEEQRPEPGTVRAKLGPRIREARLERLHGQNLEVFGREIAALMGRKRAFSNVTISNWETGRQEPSFEALVAIASLTRLPLRYFAGVGRMQDYPAIDWLAKQRGGEPVELQRQLVAASRLPTRQRALLETQLHSLVENLFRLWHNGSGR